MQYRLRLYIVGTSAASRRALKNFEAICRDVAAALRPAPLEAEVIDVLNNPSLAERMKILATPILVRELPAPARRFIGDLSDHAQVLAGLELTPAAARPDSPTTPGRLN